MFCKQGPPKYIIFKPGYYCQEEYLDIERANDTTRLAQIVTDSWTGNPARCFIACTDPRIAPKRRWVRVFEPPVECGAGPLFNNLSYVAMSYMLVHNPRLAFVSRRWRDAWHTMMNAQEYWTSLLVGDVLDLPRSRVYVEKELHEVYTGAAFDDEYDIAHMHGHGGGAVIGPYTRYLLTRGQYRPRNMVQRDEIAARITRLRDVIKSVGFTLLTDFINTMLADLRCVV